MKKKNILMILPALLTLCLPLSCSEQDEVGEFDDWQQRNAQYLDSIAAVARANADGSWTVYPAFTMSDSLGPDADNNYYVYVQKIENGSGTLNPQFNDSVRIHYSGRLIPSDSYPQGYNFGKSYNGPSLNEATDVPTLLAVNANVVGMATAIMHMVVGDRWRVIVPYYLGYGSSSSSSYSIPAYSTLIFEVKLARIYRYQIDTDTGWW